MKKGFTLIELLVVIAIIGVLSSTILGSLSDARAQARDARRLSDIRSIQTALEVYYTNNGTYPTDSWQGSHNGSWDTFESTLGTTLPVDPINESDSASANAATDDQFVYSYFGHPSTSYCSGGAYMLVFNLEKKNGDGANDGIELCDGNNRAYGNAFTVGVDQYGQLKGPDTSGTPK
ncbi:hypothetical protein CL684_01550 [Candidatus Campbellbacteria bacterium]|nr:hypothetical protein [Candidatus Campbellbacteria bacterium]|tara:strand:+ start:73 stop:603 length:531 start_codon:yes stop_codon:yes gene_type:complete